MFSINIVNIEKMMKMSFLYAEISFGPLVPLKYAFNFRCVKISCQTITCACISRTFKAKMTNWLSGQTWPTDYQGKHDQLTIRSNITNWLSRQTGPTDYQGTHDQLTIKANMTNWLSGQTWPTDYQRMWPTIKAKVTNWLSRQKWPTSYQRQSNKYQATPDLLTIKERMAKWLVWLLGGNG